MNHEPAVLRSDLTPVHDIDRKRGLFAPVSRLDPSGWLLLVGTLALTVPTMVSIARFSWSTEQGGHGPLVLATGLWLLAREWKSAAIEKRTGNRWIATAMMAVCLAAYIFARATGILEIEGFALYGALLSAAFALWGRTFLAQLWFPIVYLGFIFPPPDSWVAAITQPIKIAISAQAVNFLHFLGYPIGSSGVTIQIAQYELLIAAACAGLNSLISLAAICLFYIYMRHNANWRYALILFLTIIPIAIFANFFRVIILVLLTYYFGDAAAQGFMHDFAGLVMFAIAMATIIAFDSLLAPLRRRLATEV